MKIIQLVTRDCVGGVQAVAHGLHRGFKAAGHDSSLWFFSDTEETTVALDGSRSLFKMRKVRLYYLRLLWKLLSQLWRERPDAVIAHTTNTAVPGLALAALAGIGKRVAVQHNPLNSYSAIARRADRLCAGMGVYWRNVTVADAVTLTMSEYSANAASRVRRIHNGMDPPAPKAALSTEERAAMRSEFGLPPGVPVMVTIGRLTEQKNHQTLVAAMRLMEGVVLAIAGDGPLREVLIKKIEVEGVVGKVRMLGSLDPERVRTLLRVSDVFVTLSHFEAMPMVVLEAMQEGAIIVASDIEAHRELLADEGQLIPASPEKVQATVRRLLRNPELCERLSRGAVERSLQFSEAAMVEGYLRLLEEV